MLVTLWAQEQHLTLFQKVGHIRVFAAFASLASLSALIAVVYVNPIYVDN